MKFHTLIIISLTSSISALPAPQGITFKPTTPALSPTADTPLISTDTEVIPTAVTFKPTSETTITGPIVFTPPPAKQSPSSSKKKFTPTPTPTPTPRSTTKKAVSPLPIATPTPTPKADSPLACVRGGRGVEIGGYEIDYALVTVSGALGRGWSKISASWEKEHRIGELSMTIGADWSDYGEFKCQYSCNAMQGCASFAGWRVGDHFECHMYDALINGEDFVSLGRDYSTYTSHAFNKIC